MVEFGLDGCANLLMMLGVCVGSLPRDPIEQGVEVTASVSHVR